MTALMIVSLILNAALLTELAAEAGKRHRMMGAHWALDRSYRELSDDHTRQKIVIENLLARKRELWDLVRNLERANVALGAEIDDLNVVVLPAKVTT